MVIEIRESKSVGLDAVIQLYKANGWSSAEKPYELHNALLNSHSLVTAWHDDRLVGLGNALSDGFLVVYYPHLLVHPNYQGKGIGKQIISKLQERYSSFHQQILVADGNAVNFYESCGFELAGQSKSMWIYSGNEH